MTAAPIPATVASPGRRAAAEAALYAAAVAVTTVVLVAGLRLDRADFAAPFAYDMDALLILPMVKETVETGTHWRTARLGAPGTQELYDFPVIDHLHFAGVWLVGRLDPDPVVAFNLYYLLTYPLTALTGLYVTRRVGLSAPSGLLVALLYTFQPYHYLRGQVHYFLAAYYVVPLTLMVTLDLCRGRLPFFRPAGGRRGGFSAVAVALLTASAGAYYAFFGCGFLLAAGLYGWVQAKTWRAPAAALVLVGVVAAGGVANHGPAVWFQYHNGENSRPRERHAEEAELYGLKIAQMVLPVAGHNPVAVGETVLVDLAAVRAMYQAPQVKDLTEGDWDPVGLVGAAGYVGLLASAVLPGRRRWPVGPLAGLTVAGTLVGTLGGFGAVFNLLVSPQVRCYNRVSIFLAFLALVAAGWALDWAAGRVARGRVRREHVLWPVAALLLAVGLWDQLNDQWFPDLRLPAAGAAGPDGARGATARRFAADRDFFGRIEELVPDGMVFNFPFVEYPEARPVYESGATGKIESYDHAVGYLHTRTVRWSFGTMKGREWDTWMRAVLPYREPVPRFLERIAVAGFDGLLVDSRGLNPVRWRALQKDLEQYLGHGALREVHKDRKLYFYDLRGYRESLRRGYGPAGFDARARAEREGLLVLWLKGFSTYEPTGYEDRVHWCGGSGRLVLFNRADAPVTVTARMRFKAGFKGTGRLTIDSPLKSPDGTRWAAEVEVGPGDKPPEYTVTVVVPPGRHPVAFAFAPDGGVLPTDSRRLLFTVRDFRLN